MNKTFKLTQKGIVELEQELEGLIDKRPEITERIRTARELGDLSENAEYASARTEQDRCEGRIKEVNNILKNVEVIKETGKSSKVKLGSKVKLEGVKSGKSREYQVVGTVEADPIVGKISDESPIGQALLGKSVKDTVDIVTPAETVSYTIVSIS